MAARILLVLTILAGLYGCGQLDLSSPEQAEQDVPAEKANEQRRDGQKPDKVVVNEGLSKEEEEKLNQRLEELEEKVAADDTKDSQATPDPPEQSSQPEESEQEIEDEVRAAAESYYEAAAVRDWEYTYSSLDSETQSAYSEDEWFATNDQLADQAPGTFTVQSVDLDDSSQGTFANVSVLLTFEDGSTNTRNTYFVHEDGVWKHRFAQEEYDLFATAQSGTSSASPSASSSQSSDASADSDTNVAAGTKRVKVIISSDVPVDISISDDDLDWFVTEEITGTKTYERDIESASGLSVDAINSDFRGNVSIEVYEDGTLRTQDSDSTGLAQVTY